MVILALDTTTRTGSVALRRGAELLGERASDPAQPPASRLPGDLMEVLAAGGATIHDVDIFAVAVGPGSFTGLRVGIATMQGLAFAAARPLIGISAFDALASIAAALPAAPPRLATWVEAWRGEVFAALYGDGRQIEGPAVEHPDALLARLAGGAATLFIGDGAATYGELIRRTLGAAGVIATPAAPPLAGTIAALAASAAAAGHLPPPHAIRPLYVRRAETELLRDARPVS